MTTPVMDVVILVHDVPAWADLCIRAVEAHTRNPVRIIIVDNASELPETKALLKEAGKRGHLVIHLPENKSFSNGVNVGIGAGTAKFVCILNDDAIVTDGWDGALIQDASQKEVGLVGARSNYASGAQMDPTFIGEPPFLVFVCVALRRDVWEKVGPMDEVNFDGFSSEDLDYSWRVVKHGFKLKVSSAYVMHAGSRTLASTTGDALARQRNDAKYNQRLVEKWGRDWVIEHTKLQFRGLVATYSAEEHVKIDFLRSLMGLRRTDGVGFAYYHHTRSPIHLARQLVCDYALDNGFDWLVQLDDDATFPDDVLRRLLSHQKDVVCALAYQRRPPYLTCAYETEKDGIMGTPLEGIEHTGLRKVDVSGFHCSIIRTSVIKRLREGTKDADGKVLVPGTRQYFGGFDNKVGEDFAFPVAPETPVLGEDWGWKPISAFRAGDVVIGFDEKSPPFSSRRFKPAVVERVVNKVLPRVRIITDEQEMVTTAEHPWLSNLSSEKAPKTGWKWSPAGSLRPSMVVAAVVPVVQNPNVKSEAYSAGYIQGMFHSDGFSWAQKVTSSSGREHRYDNFCTKMKDTAPLERLATALATLQIESSRGPVEWDGDGHHAPMHSVFVRTKADAAKLKPIVDSERLPSVEFAAGYLAGKYDGDGSHYGGGMFIHSIVDWKKDRLEEAARLVGVPFTARDGRNVRICGQDNIFRFWQAVRPAMIRRMSLLGQPGNDEIQRGKEVKHRPVVIRAIEPLPAAEVLCLVTSSSTFIANGLGSHNCLNLRKLGIQVHVDTELVAGHIGSALVIDENYKKAHREGRAP